MVSQQPVWLQLWFMLICRALLYSFGDLCLSQEVLSVGHELEYSYIHSDSHHKVTSSTGAARCEKVLVPFVYLSCSPKSGLVLTSLSLFQFWGKFLQCLILLPCPEFSRSSDGEKEMEEKKKSSKNMTKKL